MAGRWVSANGNVINVASIPKPHLINILRMNVRMARSFIQKADPASGADWRDFVPRIHAALVRRAKALGLPESEWEDVEQAQPRWAQGTDKLIRRRIHGEIAFSCDSFEAAQDILARAYTLVHDRTIRGQVDREDGFATVHIDKNPDYMVDETTQPIGRTRPVELPG